MKTPNYVSFHSILKEKQSGLFPSFWYDEWNHGISKSITVLPKSILYSTVLYVFEHLCGSNFAKTAVGIADIVFVVTAQ